MEIIVVDCNKDGLVLNDGQNLPWNNVAVVGSCLPAPGCPNNFFLKLKDKAANVTVRFLAPGISGSKKTETKVLDFCKKHPDIRLVIKKGYFGKMRPWHPDQ